MVKANAKARCTTCNKEKSSVRCEGCKQLFCFNHLTEHRQQLTLQLDEIEGDRNLFRQNLTDQTNNLPEHLLIKEIDQWKKDSIKKVQQTAKECRKILFQHTTEHINPIEVKLTIFTDQLKETRAENDFNEIDLNELEQKLTQLLLELDKLSNYSIQHDSGSFINKISVVRSSSNRQLDSPPHININTKWKQNGITVAGGNGNGNQLNQLNFPQGIFIDDTNQCIYIADCCNHRIVEWRYGAKNGQVVAGGNGNGSRTDQLDRPTDVIIDKKNDSLIICDYKNRRVVRWTLRDNTNGQIIISDIDCYGLAMDGNGDLYVSDVKKHQVRRYKIGDTNGTIVAGGNGEGNNLNQFNHPVYIFVDQDYSIYVSDWKNHRVMKWVKGAKEGIVVAGGQGEGDSLVQLRRPVCAIVDHLGNVYVADFDNHRITRWSKGTGKGDIVVGVNGEGSKSNQFHGVKSLSFDRQGNLYLIDRSNNSVQKFEIDSN